MQLVQISPETLGGRIELNPWTIARSLMANATLIGQLALKELRLKYKVSFLGPLWAILTPLIHLGVYAFIFSYIFQSRWATETSDGVPVPSVFMLFSGLVVFIFFSECITRSPDLITSNRNFVKKVIFPLEVLPFGPFFAAWIQSLVSLCLLIAGMIIFGPGVTVMILWLPILFIPLLLVTLSLMWLLSLAGVLIPDMANITRIVIQFLFFLSAIFYPIDVVPESVRFLFWINPIAVSIGEFRNVLIIGESPPVLEFFIYTLCATCFFIFSYSVFMKARRVFAENV